MQPTKRCLSDFLRRAPRGFGRAVFAVIATSLMLCVHAPPVFAQTAISLPFTNSCDFTVIGPDTLTPMATSGSVSLVPGVPNGASGVSLININAQLASIETIAGFSGTLNCHLAIGELVIDIPRSILLHIGTGFVHETHSYTFAPISLIVPFDGGTLAVSDTAHTYDVTFGIPRPQGMTALFSAEPATLLVTLPSPPEPIPTLGGMSLFAVALAVAWLGILAIRGRSHS